MESWLERGPVIVKPRFGHQGEGVYLVSRLPGRRVQVAEHTVAAAVTCKNAAAQRRYFRQLMTRKYIVQDAIPLMTVRGRCFDLRVLVQKGRHGAWAVTNIVSRIAQAGYFNTSKAEVLQRADVALRAALGGEGVASIMARLCNNGIRAARAVERAYGRMGEVGVDFCLDTGGRLWIIEVNGCPQKSLYRQVPGLKDPGAVYRRPLEYAAYLARSPR
jgi:glutathione synthase/RimK-type ligase-like ATP-grasp enzyme